MFVTMLRREELILLHSRVVVLAPAPSVVDFALELMEKMVYSILELVLATIRLKGSHQVTNVFVGTAKAILNSILPQEFVWILTSEIILYGHLTDHHVAQKDLALFQARRSAAHTNEQGEP
jgi:hypothetical protein